MPGVSLAIVYTPAPGAMPLILGRVSDHMMLTAAIRNAASDAETRASAAAGKDVLVSRGYREQAAVLRRLLGELSEPFGSSIQ